MQRHWQAQGEPAPRLCSGNNSEGDQSDCLKPEGILTCVLSTSRLGRGRDWVGAQLGTHLQLPAP